ncbi:bestrophin family ion channel [Lignipirellula cremea]|uniref:Bestrophin, RFP-TM, chloride channel n=1 Tax=Lignipirellula cremea TaxID=2528010 RepID=A0A518DX71_9BACT|nr:bestrophin family ion channel [Lignipirellula cremea]QDU96417.1 Bestrophin, RFP-TM, chloride channel [Lignipirellula cremea]
MYRQDFWEEVFKLQGSITPYVTGRVIVFCLIATAAWVVYQYAEYHSGIAVAPCEIVGVVLALLLVQRTNAGYDRW